MSGRLLLAAAVTAALAAGGGAPAGSAASAPVPSCRAAGATVPASCAGWFTTDVTVTWSFDQAGVTQTDCDVVTVAADTPGTRVTCRVWYGSDYVEAGTVVRRDATPPVVTGGAPERPPDGGEWYRAPVAVAFSAADATSGVAGCAGGTYAGPDSAAAVVTGTCRDVAGNAASGTVALRYDATPPAVTAVPSRPPDENGWYRSPVTVAFAGTDGLSGVAACDPPVTVRGPEERVSVAGGCRDAAGNAGGPAALVLRYDATPPPAAAAVAVEDGDGVARLRWPRVPGAARYEVVRRPGLGRAPRSTVYRGRTTAFVDRRVRNGVRYRYAVLAVDRAGNRAARVVAALPRPPVYAPAPGSVVRGPLRAAWEAAPRARFYNVQLYRGGRKVLSTWVVEPRLRVPSAWTYDGGRRTLAPGRYRVFVWPAFGTRARPRYGPLLGSTAFAVPARPR